MNFDMLYVYSSAALFTAWTVHWDCCWSDYLDDAGKLNGVASRPPLAAKSLCPGMVILYQVVRAILDS